MKSQTRMNHRDLVRFLRRLACHTLMLIAVAMFETSTYAQSFQVPGTMPDDEVVVKNVTIHTVNDATIERGYVAFQNGTITTVESGEYTGSENGRIVIDATGFHMYPGMIASSTTIGLIEIGAVRATNDRREVGNMTPEVVAITAVNPDSAIIPVTRSNGILHALVVPQGGFVSGYASIIRLDGWTTEDLVVKKRAGLVIDWPNQVPSARSRTDRERREFSERADEAIAELDALFDDAQAYLAMRRANGENQPVDLRLEALAPVIDGACPIFLQAGNAPTIRSALAWCDRRGFECVVFGGNGIDECIDELNAGDVEIVITGVHRMPSRRDGDFDEAFRLPSILREGGIRFAIAGGSGGASNERNLPYHAATAAAYGLSKGAALRAVTLDAAEVLGIGRMHGSIEVGKSADLLITNGDPLEMTTEVIAAWIHGAPVDLNDRHKSFNDKYRQRYGLPRESPGG